jgi:hypothetical protein
LIFARLKVWAAGIGLVLAALAASWLGGRTKAQADAKREEFEAYAETRKRMDEVGRMSDADAAHDWLRERGKH